MASTTQKLIGDNAEVFVDEETKRGTAFECGLVAPFLSKFSFEDREHVPSSEFYDSSDDEDDYFGFLKPRPANSFEIVKKFLKQVRESYGYDVDCIPPPTLCSPFFPVPVDSLSEAATDYMRQTHFAINKINVETGRSYVFVKLDGIVDTICSLVLLSFTVKEELDSAQPITLRAMVNVPYGTHNYELKEWSFKPPASTTTYS